jgi:hypothetical protein
MSGSSTTPRSGATPGSPPGPDAPTLRSRLELATAAIALITAIVGGIFAITSHQAQTQAQSQAASSDAQVKDLQQRLGKAQQSLTQDQQQISDLQSRLSDAGTPMPTADTTGGGIFHSGSVTLADGANADLDAPASDPQWGGPAVTSASDVAWGYGAGLEIYANWVRISEPATYETCRTTTGYTSSGTLELKYLVRGAHVCVHTDDDRYSVLTVPQTADVHGPLKLGIVTYNSTS